MRLADWQFYWPRWYRPSALVHYDEATGIYNMVVVIGPLQLWFRQ